MCKPRCCAIHVARSRAAWNGGKGDGPPVNWVQIHQTPDYVYFNHAVHVNRGVSCFSCHGAVNEMHVVSQREPQSMKWCLDCHRHPEQYVRPREEVFKMGYEPPIDQIEMGRKLVQEYKIRSLTSCSTCHR